MKELLTAGEYAALTGSGDVSPNTRRVLKCRLRKKFEVFLDKELAVLVEAFPKIVNADVNSINRDVDGAAIRIFPETAPFVKSWCGRRDLDPGLELGRLGGNSATIDYRRVRADFTAFLESRNLNRGYVEKTLRYLDRYVTVIEGPMDVVRVFSGLTNGQQHNLIRGVRSLFNFLEAQGFSVGYLNVLRKNIPRDSVGVDVRIPSEEEILDSLRRLGSVPVKYQALFNLLLDSGLRLVEAVDLINGFKGAEEVNGFYRCDVGSFRGSKQSYYAHFTYHTLKQLRQQHEGLKCGNVSHYFHKYRYVTAKYLRKFAFDKMIELEVPESVADFIQGRVARKIGARHYMSLARQASKFYPRYAEYVKSLRDTAGLASIDRKTL